MSVRIAEQYLNPNQEIAAFTVRMVLCRVLLFRKIISAVKNILNNFWEK